LFGYESARDSVFSNVRRAQDLVADTFCPALAALVYLSELRGDNELAEKMRRALEDTAGALTHLGSIAPKSVEDVTGESVFQLWDALEVLRTATWDGGWSANDVLNRAELGSTPAPLCFGLREFFSAPWAILSQLADDSRRQQGMAGLPIAVDPYLLVCPVPVEDLRGMLHPLIKNIRDHGDVRTLQLFKRDETPPLIVGFRNTVSQPGPNGGLGVELAKAKAAPFGVKIESVEESKGVWLTQIVFPRFFRGDAIHSPHRKL
jgi:hypothetical protein